MAETHKPHRKVSEDDLLAKAIPIDAEETDDADVEPIELEGGDESEPIALEEADEEAPAIELSEADGDEPAKEIRTFDRHASHIEDSWQRAPAQTGQGASHVRTFVAKLRPDAIEHLDEQVNEWLDAHPDFEVKLVTTTIGELMGKLREPALFMNVWV